MEEVLVGFVGDEFICPRCEEVSDPSSDDEGAICISCYASECDAAYERWKDRQLTTEVGWKI